MDGYEFEQIPGDNKGPPGNMSAAVQGLTRVGHKTEEGFIMVSVPLPDRLRLSLLINHFPQGVYYARRLLCMVLILA